MRDRHIELITSVMLAEHRRLVGMQVEKIEKKQKMKYITKQRRYGIAVDCTTKPKMIVI